MCLGLGETVCYFNLVRLKIIVNIFSDELKILLAFNHGALEMKSYIVFFFFLLSFFLLFSSCKKSTEPIYNPQTLQLTVADVSCTEAWLKLKAQIAQKDSSDLKLQLYRNDSLIVNKPFTSTDSVLYIDGLQPATSYAFTAKVLNGTKLLATSTKVEATTMDTTSHNFTWQTFEFGGINGSSYFKDVAIIDENDIWAVGEIHTKDTDHWNEDSTKWLQPYNAAHWNGEKWELKRIPYVDKNGYAWVTPLYSILAFSHNDIWFEGGVHWNGSRFVSLRMNINFPSHVNKIWGTSDNNLYIVGNKGLIAHYDGKQWQRIESGTEENINDIYGMKMGFNKYIYLAVGTVLTHTIPSVIKINSKNKAIKINWPYKDRIPHSVWFDNHNLIYVAGGEIIRSNYLNSWQIVSNLPRTYLRRIRGISKNDIFVSGDFLILSHFNGLTWKLYESYKNGIYYSLDYKENTVVIVGDHEGKAIIKIGKR